jgi:hypothetical protein
LHRDELQIDLCRRFHEALPVGVQKRYGSSCHYRFSSPIALNAFHQKAQIRQLSASPSDLTGYSFN